MSASITAALEKAKLAERVVPVCLDADAIEAYREAESASAKAAAASDSLRGAETSIPPELIDAVKESTVRLTLRARNRREWRDLLKKHPPRQGNLVDRQLGCNEETFYEDLVKVSIVDPVVSDEEWEQLNAVLTEGEWTKLVDAASGLNLKVSQLPF